MKKFLPALLALAAFAGAARAQTCTVYGQPTYSPYYGAPVYNPSTYYYPQYQHKVYETIVPILQPLPFFIDPRISYLHNGGNYIQVPFQLQTQLQVQAAAQAQPQAQAQTQPQTQAPATQAQRQPPTDIDALIDQIEKRAAERNRVRPSEEDGPPPVPGRRVSRATLASSASAILKRSCASCHNDKKQQGDVQIFHGAALARNLDRQAVLDAIQEGRMPPENSKKHRVSVDELQQIKREWGL